ncbi:cupin domain-containing protein [Deinococcus hopiensis]|nr:cupin domain-containing protein [Deinococcus hopiensis]
MPPDRQEVRHYHQQSRQFFFVLQGSLTLEVEGATHELRRHEGYEVAPLQAHQALNRSDAFVEFLVISQPRTQGDRILAP